MAAADDVSLRLARDEEWEAIAALHAASWTVAYRGFLPDRYLDEEVADERAEAWRAAFAERAGTLTIVAEDGRDLVGFAHTVLAADPEWGNLLDNLHAHPSRHRSGIGQRLVHDTARRLVEMGAPPGLHLWVIEGNARARAFYDAMGGQPSGSGTWDRTDGDVPLIRYAWPDVRLLA